MRIQDGLHYPHTTANHATYVGMGIPGNSHYPHTNANHTIRVGAGIPTARHYPYTDANRTAYVGMSILGNPQYPHTDAKPRLLGVNGDALTSMCAGFSLIHHRNGVIRITNEALTFTVGGEFLPSQLI